MILHNLSKQQPKIPKASFTSKFSSLYLLKTFIIAQAISICLKSEAILYASARELSVSSS